MALYLRRLCCTRCIRIHVACLILDRDRHQDMLGRRRCAGLSGSLNYRSSFRRTHPPPPQRKAIKACVFGVPREQMRRHEPVERRGVTNTHTGEVRLTLKLTKLWRMLGHVEAPPKSLIRGGHPWKSIGACCQES